MQRLKQCNAEACGGKADKVLIKDCASCDWPAATLWTIEHGTSQQKQKVENH